MLYAVQQSFPELPEQSVYFPALAVVAARGNLPEFKFDFGSGVLNPGTNSWFHKIFLYVGDSSENTVVNTTASSNTFPIAARLQDGSVFTAWYSGANGQQNLTGRIINADGTFATGEFAIDGPEDGNTNFAKLIALDNGGAAVVWQTRAGTEYQILARTFDSTGNATSDSFVVTSSNGWAIENQQVVALAGGDLMVIWSDANPYSFRPTNLDLFAKVFNSNGEQVTDTFNLHPGGAGHQQGVKIQSLEDGRFVAFYAHTDTLINGYTSWSLKAQFFDADGGRSGDVLSFDQHYGHNYFVMSRPDGGFALCSGGGGSLGQKIEIFDATGTSDGKILTLPSGVNIKRWIDGDTFVAITSAYDSLSRTSQYMEVRYDVVEDSTGPVVTGTSDDDILQTKGLSIANWGPGNTASGLGGNDRLFGRPFDDDTLVGGDGNDILNGQGGRDALYGGHGNDVYVLAKPQPVSSWQRFDRSMVDESQGSGTDTIVTRWESIDLEQYSGIEVVKLAGARDLDIFGNAGANTLRGNAGDNIIEGRGGRDVVTGGAGRDTFVFGALDCDDDTIVDAVIKDFTRGEDKIDLSQFNLPFDTVRLTAATGGLMVEAGPEGDRIQIKLLGISGLTSSDFVLAPGMQSYAVKQDADRLIEPGHDPDRVEHYFTPPSLPGNGSAPTLYYWSSSDRSNPDDSNTSNIYLSRDPEAGTIVNTTLPGYQSNPVALRLSDSKAIIAWSSSDTDGVTIRGRLIGANGEFASDEFVIQHDSGIGLAPRELIELEDGNVMLIAEAWIGEDTQLRAQVFRVTGTSEAWSEIDDAGRIVGSHLLDDGQVAIVYRQSEAQDLWLRILAEDGSPIGTAHQLSPYGSYRDSALEARPGGGFSVAWYVETESGWPQTLETHIQLFDARGQLEGNEIVIPGAYDIVNWTSDSRFEAHIRKAHGDGDWTDDIFAADFKVVSTGSGADLVGTGFNDVLKNTGLGGAVYGLAGSDRLTGRDADDDRLFGGSGDDLIAGRAGDDVLTGGDGDDRLDGGAGYDTLIGGRGDDVYCADNFDYNDDGYGDYVIEREGGGYDTIVSSASGIGLFDFVEAGVLRGNLNLSLSGNDLDNRLIGNDGDNRINGWRGRDVMTGGAGADTFIFQLGEATDSSACDGVISDFMPGVDKISVWSNGTTERVELSDIDWHLSDSGRYMLVDIETVRGPLHIFLTGVTSLTAGDFVL